MDQNKTNSDLLDLISREHNLNNARVRRNERNFEAVKHSFYAVVALMALLTGIFFAVVSALDQNIDNQNTMLCESAKISKNEAYTEACDAYYDHGDIKYMRNFNAKEQN